MGTTLKPITDEELKTISQIAVPVNPQPPLHYSGGWKVGAECDDVTEDSDNVCQHILENLNQPFGWIFSDDSKDQFIIQGVTFTVEDVKVEYRNKLFVWIISISA